MMNRYDVRIKTDNTVKGNDIHLADVPARSHAEAMHRALAIRNITQDEWEQVIVTPTEDVIPEKRDV